MSDNESKAKPSGENGKNGRDLHLVVQGKGGAGKSLVASLICQNYQHRKKDYVAIDLDPVNRSLSAIKELKAEPWDIMKSHDQASVDPGRFDDLVEEVVNTPCDIVIDTGSTSFIPFTAYLIEQDITDLLKENGVNTTVHVVLRSGSSLIDCLNGLNSICEAHSPDSTTIFVWLNEVEGPIENEGKEFEDMAVYDKHKDRISGILHIPQQSNELYQSDMTNMLKNYQTFQQAIKADTTRLVSKQRLKQLENYFHDAMMAAF